MQLLQLEVHASEVHASGVDCSGLAPERASLVSSYPSVLALLPFHDAGMEYYYYQWRVALAWAWACIILYLKFLER